MGFICSTKETNKVKEWFFGREVELPKPLAQLSLASPARKAPRVRTFLLGIFSNKNLQGTYKSEHFLEVASEWCLQRLWDYRGKERKKERKRLM